MPSFEGRARLQLDMPVALKKRLARLAAREQRSMMEVAREALEDYLSRQEDSHIHSQEDSQ